MLKGNTLGRGALDVNTRGEACFEVRSPQKDQRRGEEGRSFHHRGTKGGCLPGDEEADERDGQVPRIPAAFPSLLKRSVFF